MADTATLDAPVADEPIIGGEIEQHVDLAQEAEAPVEQPAPRGIEDLSDDELASHERIRLREEQVAERVRKELAEQNEHEVARRLQVAARDYVHHGRFAADIHGIVRKAIDEGASDIRPEAIQNVLTAGWAGLLNHVVEQADEHIGKLIGDYSIPSDRVDALRAAERAYAKDPAAAQRLLNLRIDTAVDAEVARRLPEIEKQAEAKYRKDAEAASRNRQEQEQVRDARGAAQPSGARGTSAGGGTPMRTVNDAAQAFNQGRISAAEYGHLRDTLPYG